MSHVTYETNYYRINCEVIFDEFDRISSFCRLVDSLDRLMTLFPSLVNLTGCIISIVIPFTFKRIADKLAPDHFDTIEKYQCKPNI